MQYKFLVLQLNERTNVIIILIHALFFPLFLLSSLSCPLFAYRWLKFEEDVEDGGERWSKPYVATLSLHSLFELRSCILNGTVMLDMRANSLEEIAGTEFENIVQTRSSEGLPYRSKAISILFTRISCLLISAI